MPGARQHHAAACSVALERDLELLEVHRHLVGAVADAGGQETGADAQITILEGATHFDVPERAFLDEGLDIVGWLIGRESEPEPEPQTYTLLDALQVLYRMLSGETAAACDPNGDGALDLRDVLWILKRIAA